MPPNVTFRPSVVAFHFPLTGFGFDMIKLLQTLSLFLWGRLDSGNCWISFPRGAECQFLSGRNISNRTLNHYSLIESEMYYFSCLFSGTTESLLISAGMPARGRVSEGVWGRVRGGRVCEGRKFSRGVSVPELDTLMNEQNSPPSLWNREWVHNNRRPPLPTRSRGAGGHSFASALPQSLAFSRAFLIQRKHPQQNKTIAICSISPRLPPQSRWLSTGACFASAKHWSIAVSNQNINCLNLETFDKLQAPSFALWFCETCLFSVLTMHWHFNAVQFPLKCQPKLLFFSFCECRCLFPNRKALAEMPQSWWASRHLVTVGALKAALHFFLSLLHIQNQGTVRDKTRCQYWRRGSIQTLLYLAGHGVWTSAGCCRGEKGAYTNPPQAVVTRAWKSFRMDVALKDKCAVVL